MTMALDDREQHTYDENVWFNGVERKWQNHLDEKIIARAH
jgi:hypothetical protein